MLSSALESVSVITIFLPLSVICQARLSLGSLLISGASNATLLPVSLDSVYVMVVLGTVTLIGDSGASPKGVMVNEPSALTETS